MEGEQGRTGEEEKRIYGGRGNNSLRAGDRELHTEGDKV